MATSISAPPSSELTATLVAAGCAPQLSGFEVSEHLKGLFVDCVANKFAFESNAICPVKEKVRRQVVTPTGGTPEHRRG